MSSGKKDNDIRGPVRRAADASGARRTRRPFRPIRWAWMLLLVALAAPAYDLFFPAGWHPSRERRTVVIERGQTLHEIAQELQRVGIIRSQVGFLVLARAMRLDRSVKAGQYSLRIGITVPSLLRSLDRGMYGLNLVTIPEGLMISETARLIERQVGIPANALDSLSRDPYLLDSLQIGAPSLEGWLAPDSYEWLPGTSPEVILRTMVARTRERVQRATAGYDSLPLGMNAHEVLTLASIVESESRAREERPRIARVYLNRLDRGMLLQADPTVGYALGRGPRSRLTFKDLRVVSPYNTYRHEGLPPGPICSPGAAAIEAVMNATPGINDLYFVARGEGRHIFAPTYEQHLANIAYVRGKQAAAARKDDDDVVGADVDTTLPRPVMKQAGQAPAAPTEPPQAAAATPAPSGAAGAAAAGTALKGTLLVPKATIHTAGSEAISPTLVKPAAGDSARPRPKLAAPTDPPATKPGGAAVGDSAKSAAKSAPKSATASKPAPATTTGGAAAAKPAATKPPVSKPAAGTTSTKSTGATTTDAKPSLDPPAKPAAGAATDKATTTSGPAKPAVGAATDKATTTNAPAKPAASGTQAPAKSSPAPAKPAPSADDKASGSATTAKPASKPTTKSAAPPKPAKRDTTKTP